MGISFLITAAVVIFFILLKINGLNRRKKTDLFTDNKNSFKAKIDNYIAILYSFYYSGVLYFLIFMAVFSLLVYSIKKAFLLPFIYGNLIILLSSFLDVLLNYLLSIYFYPSIISDDNKEEMKNVFLSVKGLLFIVLLYTFFSLYLRFLTSIDYVVVFSGSAFASFLIYLISTKNYKKISSFLNYSYFSILFINSILLFMNFASLRDIKIIVMVSFAYYISLILNSLFSRYISFIKYEEISSRFIFFVSFFLFSFLIFFNSYDNNFIYLSFLITFFMIYFMLKIKMEGIYLVAGVFVVLFSMHFISVILSKSLIEFRDKNNILFFLFLINLAPVYNYLKELEFENLFSFNKDPDKLNEFALHNLKIGFLIIFFSFNLVFTMMYNLMNRYYGYTDSLDISVFFVSMLFFYFYELSGEKIFSKIDNLFLHLVYNLSITIFLFSFAIVIVSYSLNPGFINFYTSYLILAFLVLVISKFYYPHLISVFYLSLFYLFSYVNG